ncbi:hypothetical protein A1Q2_05348 [Trichosporon asahii var. asahii CBS 8904]|uniref:Uncharacterized protein n=1 Tax=Trichosporon asahii var. asahii (strain CBS 8904) TaxID=1220162 RepID=K1WFN0_TRIAC|nr:hypothetical protein A1Q2_05348 [Trichosporon asahii var. asahii CBS 8904]
MLFGTLLALACASAATAAPLLARQVSPTYPDGSIAPVQPAGDQTGALQGMMGGPMNPVENGATADAQMESLADAIKNLQEVNDLFDKFIKKGKDAAQGSI